MDLNADLGESWYGHRIGDDEALMPLLGSCNIACGFHGGDARTMQRTIALAMEHGVNIGAHPSYPDREHFGRRKMQLPPDQLKALILYQVSALWGMVTAAGGRLTHLKVHGALYHEAAFGPDDQLANAVVEVATQCRIPRLYGPQDSHLESATVAAGLEYWAEGFADRRYKTHNRLVNRKEPGAILADPNACARQSLSLARGAVTTADGRTVAVNVATICLHGDHRGAAERGRAVHNALQPFA